MVEKGAAEMRKCSQKEMACLLTFVRKYRKALSQFLSEVECYRTAKLEFDNNKQVQLELYDADTPPHFARPVEPTAKGLQEAFKKLGSKVVVEGPKK
jgi:hypothetical protein